MHLKSTTRRFPITIILVMVGVVLAVLAVYYFKVGIINSYSFDLKNISCVSSKTLENDLNAKGKYFWQVDFNQIHEKILAKYYCVGQINFEYIFPTQLKISAESRIPLSQVSFNPSSKLSLTSTEASSSTVSAVKNFDKLPVPAKPTFVVDKNGVVYGQTYDNSLPTIFIPDSHLNIGYTFDGDRLNKVAQVFDYLNTKLADLISFPDSSVKQYKLSNYDLVILSNPGVIISLKKDIAGQLASLQLILSAAKINQRPIKYVDLRFNKPIVVYEPSKKS